ncbi:MAG: thiamine diphosphokinase [Pelolinea sp.]|nr:thiamine diphosphokinase [Pelolinea sp.]
MRAVVFANGVIPDIYQVHPLILDADFIVSADGGLRFIRALNLIPMLLIGDLDSVSGEDIQFIKDNNVEIIKFPADKDQTDLELALKELVSRGFDNILVIGALGGRIDQTLANIGLIQLFTDQDITIEFDDGQDHVFLIEDRQRIGGKAGDIVSLIPICKTVNGVTTVGLKYPLGNENLFPEKTRGISNEMTGDAAEITITSGRLLCIHSSETIIKEM